MGRDFYDASPAAKDIFDRAATLLGGTFLDTMFHGSEADVTDTRFAQPALVAAEVAMARHLQSMGVTPSACAGHSVGEFAALVIAGALAFEDAMILTRERGRLMSENVPSGGMAAVLGLQAPDIEAALPPGVEVANYNGTQQTIISGSIEGLAAAETSLRAAGARRVMRLNVSGPFHSSLMAGPGDKFRDALRGISVQAPHVRFVSSVTGSDEMGPERIKELLWRQLSAPVRWTDVMQTLGPVPAAECGPGTVLQGIAKRMDGGPHVSPAGTMAQAEAFEVENIEAVENEEI